MVRAGAHVHSRCCKLAFVPRRVSRADRGASSACRAATVGKDNEVSPNGNGVLKEKKDKKQVEKDEPVFEDAYDVANLTLDQVQDLVNVVSEETNLAEVHLKLQDVEVRFKRGSSTLPAVAPPPPPPAPAAPLPTASFTPPPISAHDAGSSEDSVDDADLGIVPVQAKKVGTLRRNRHVRGREVGKTPLVTEGTVVKNKQELAYIDQLGTLTSIVAPMEGEVVKILAAEGSPVEYDQTVFEMQPTMASSGSRIR